MLRAGLLSTLEMVRHAGCCWAFRISRDGKFRRVSRQSVLGLCWPPHLTPEHTLPELVANLATEKVKKVKKFTTIVFLNYPSSSYGIPLGHSVAAALSEWASPALSASLATSFAPSKGLPLFLVLSHFSISLLKCREQNQVFNINEGL